MLSQWFAKRGGIRDLTIHLIPAIIVVSLFEMVCIEVYLHAPIHDSGAKFFIWCAAQAVGGFVLGYLSDRFCRKRMLVITQACGILLIPFLFLQSFSILPLFLIGLLFNPSPVARAALIDNFPKESKAKLIAITYVAQFVPWCFYFTISGLGAKGVLTSVFAILIVNTIISHLFFEDRRDKKQEKQDTAKNFTNKKGIKRTVYTLGALLPGQLVFFISDTFFENITSNASLFSVLGIGSLIGVIVGMFYRKIPHLSLLTFCFGIGILLSAVPLITNYFAPDINIYLPYQLMLFSNLGGFYLPFVFDVVLSATSANYRGTACGVIDFIISLASIVGASIVILFHPDEKVVLLATTILFLVAAIVQKRGERHA